MKILARNIIGILAFGINLAYPCLGATIANQFVTNTIDHVPVRTVFNVKASPFNAVGDNVHDDWLAIQTAITTAGLATNGPVSVYIPAGNYRLTNTLALTCSINNNNVGVVGQPTIASVFGDGARNTLLTFTMTNANGMEFRVLTNDNRHLSNFTLRDLALIGPAVSGNTNVFGNGFFFGYNADLPYAGDTPGYNDTISDCVIRGWNAGLCITNSVFFTVRNCNFTLNVLYSAYLTHADTTRFENNNLGFPVVQSGDRAAIYLARDLSGNSTAMINIGGECGNSACVVYADSAIFHQYGGNFERNDKFLYASNTCYIGIEGIRSTATDNTKPAFYFINGAAGNFWAANNTIDCTSYMFDQRPGATVIVEYPIHHAMNFGVKTNGLWNGTTPRVYSPVYFQTPRWFGHISLANAGTLNNATPLSWTSQSPAPYSAIDGVSIIGTPVTPVTGKIWLPMPYGLGSTLVGSGTYNILFTLTIQGGAGCNNAFISVLPACFRLDPVNGKVDDSFPSYSVGGITNGMSKTFTWNSHWLDDTSPRFSDIEVTATNTIYLIGLTAQTIDY